MWSNMIHLTSTAFEDGGAIPRDYTCDGENISPPLNWNGVPNEAQSLALIVDDPDAPRGSFVHWVLYNIPPGLIELPQGVTEQGPPGKLGTHGRNDSHKLRYSGPCPPRGQTHRYFFKLFALDAPLQLEEDASKAEVEQAMQGHILAQGELVGRYGR